MSAAPDLRCCTRCNKVKPVAEFGKSKPTRCRECLSEVHRNYRSRNRERWPAYHHKHYKKTLIRRLLHHAQTRAEKLGVPFELVQEDITVPEFCPVLGIKLEIAHKGFSPNSPTLDRIVPALGYIRGNVAVISGRANVLKRDATVAELEQIVNWMRNVGAL